MMTNRDFHWAAVTGAAGFGMAIACAKGITTLPQQPLVPGGVASFRIEAPAGEVASHAGHCGAFGRAFAQHGRLTATIAPARPLPRYVAKRERTERDLLCRWHAVLQVRF
jgi:hypothetical protein